MGQARNVLVYRLLCEKSIDERVMELLEEKQKVFDAFADESVSADATQKKEAEIDDKTFGTLVNEEIERINAENAAREEGA
jgi:SNF2 family DNA or RNA helicase